MILYHWFKNIFNILLPVTLIISLITSIKEKQIIEKIDTGNFSQENYKNKWQERIRTLIAIFSGAIGGYLFIWIKIRIYWILWAFCIPFYLERLVGVYLLV